MKSVPRWTFAIALVLVFAFAFASSAYVEEARASNKDCDCTYSCAGGTGIAGGKLDRYGFCQPCPLTIPCCVCDVT